MNQNGSLKGIFFFSNKILQLITRNETENISNIQNIINKNKLVQYINDKYFNVDSGLLDFPEEAYDLDEINNFFVLSLKEQDPQNNWDIKNDQGLHFILFLLFGRLEGITPNLKELLKKSPN